MKQKGESQNGGYKKTKHAKLRECIRESEMFIFLKI